MPAADSTYTAQWGIVLTAPASVTSTSKTDTTVSLSWSAVSGAVSYNVHCGAQKMNASAITSTAYTVTGLSQSTPYIFTVTAVNGGVESPQSTACSVTTNPSASNSVQFVVSNISGSAGDTITVSVVIPANSHIGAATFEVPFDSSLLEYVSAAQGDALTGGISSINYSAASSKITMTYINSDGVTAGGTILTITFKIKAGTPGQTINTNFTVDELTDEAYANLPSSVTQGTITVGMLGDINGDGMITSVDALMALQAASGRICLLYTSPSPRD